MNTPYSSFEKNIESIKMLDNIHKYFSNQLHAIDLSEILRAELVLIVSAFDCYIHDIVKTGMLEIFKGQRNENKKYNDFSIPLSYVQQIIQAENDTEKSQLIEVAIKKVNCKDSFQSPSSIENSLQLISIKNIWTLIKTELSMEPSDIKHKLGLIVNRRNKIAHEADLDSITGEKTEILSDDIADCLNFITKLTKSIDNQVITAQNRVARPELNNSG